MEGTYFIEILTCIKTSVVLALSLSSSLNTFTKSPSSHTHPESQVYNCISTVCVRKQRKDYTAGNSEEWGQGLYFLALKYLLITLLCCLSIAREGIKISLQKSKQPVQLGENIQTLGTKARRTAARDVQLFEICKQWELWDEKRQRCNMLNAL